jgi:hypothetical protein
MGDWDKCKSVIRLAWAAERGPDQNVADRLFARRDEVMS